MSVRTTADEKRDSAKEHITEAIKDLMDACHPDTYGRDEFRQDYLMALHMAIIQLERVNQKI